MVVKIALSAFGPQAHEFVIYDRELIVEFADLTPIDMNNFAGDSNFSIFLEYFGVIEAWIAGDESPIGFVGLFGAH